MTPTAATSAADVWALANYGAIGVVAAFALTLLAIGAKWLLSELRRKDVQFSESLRYVTDKHEAAVQRVLETHEKTSQALVNSIDRLSTEVRSNGSRG